MIQRIQSVYLFIALICISLLIFFPLFSVKATSNGMDESLSVESEFGAYGLVFTGQTESMQDANLKYQAFDLLADDPDAGKFPVYFLYISLALLTAAALLLYKNRKRQLLFARLSFVMHLLFTIAVVGFYYFGTSAIKEAVPVSANITVTFALKIGFYLLVAAIPLLLLAIRGIKNDENLVKSLDRIR